MERCEDGERDGECARDSLRHVLLSVGIDQFMQLAIESEMPEPFLFKFKLLPSQL